MRMLNAARLSEIANRCANWNIGAATNLRDSLVLIALAKLISGKRSTLKPSCEA